jgi:hypothetical protein
MSPGTKSPTEVVEQLWKLATQGDLLTPEGWDEASQKYFTEAARSHNRKTILVMSNDWGVSTLSSGNHRAEVDVGYLYEGSIDSSLRYTAPPKQSSSIEIKYALTYHLVTDPTFSLAYGRDGKTLVNGKPTGYFVWRVTDPEGPSWTTVNTAIRYVLEMRNKTTNPVIKKNADRTLKELLRWH